MAGLFQNLIESYIQQGRDSRAQQALMAAMYDGTPQDQVNITPRVTDPGPLMQAMAGGGTYMPSAQGPTPTGGVTPKMYGQDQPMPPPVQAPTQPPSPDNSRIILPGQAAPFTPPANVQPMGQGSPQLAQRAASGAYAGPAPPGDIKSVLSAMPPSIGLPFLTKILQNKINPQPASELGQLNQDVTNNFVKPEDMAAYVKKQTYIAPRSAESPVGKAAQDLKLGLIDQKGYDAIVAKETALPGQGAESPLGKLAADFKAGRISQEDYNAAVIKENRLPPAPQPTDASYLAPVLAKIQRGEPLTEQDNAVLSVLKPSANVEPPPGANVPGTLGAPKIDVSAEGYSTKAVPNTGGLTQSAIDQGAIEFATTGKMPSGMGIGSTGAGGQRKNAIQNRAGELNVGGNMAANATQLKSFSQSLGQQQKYLDSTQRALNTANDTLDALQEWMQKNNVNPSQFPDFNTFNNFLKAKGVDPGVAGGYNAQLATLRAEYSQVLAKGGVRSVETDREAAKLIPAGLAPSQLAQVAERIKVDGANVTRDAQNQVAKVTNQMNNILGGNASASNQPPPTGGGLPSGVTEEDIQHTLKLHPEMTRDKLLQKLGGK